MWYHKNGNVNWSIQSIYVERQLKLKKNYLSSRDDLSASSRLIQVLNCRARSLPHMTWSVKARIWAAARAAASGCRTVVQPRPVQDKICWSINKKQVYKWVTVYTAIQSRRLSCWVFLTQPYNLGCLTVGTIGQCSKISEFYRNNFCGN